MLGVDVGSTTVKLVCRPQDGIAQNGPGLLFRDYRRHESRQLTTLLASLRELEAALPVTSSNTRLFVTGSGGARISISSISGFGASARTPPYGAVKAAIISYTQSEALVLAKKGIRVNCIAPGSIEFQRWSE